MRPTPRTCLPTLRGRPSGALLSGRRRFSLPGPAPFDPYAIPRYGILSLCRSAVGVKTTSRIQMTVAKVRLGYPLDRSSRRQCASSWDRQWRVHQVLSRRVKRGQQHAVQVPAPMADATPSTWAATAPPDDMTAMPRRCRSVGDGQNLMDTPLTARTTRSCARSGPEEQPISLAPVTSIPHKSAFARPCCKCPLSSKGSRSGGKRCLQRQPSAEA